IKCFPTYPKDRPEASFNSPTFHPNNDSSYGSVCMSLLDDWQSCYSLLDLVRAMPYFIDHPDFDSPNNSFGILSDLAQLPTMTTCVLAGLSVKGRRFPSNAAWFEWARDNGCLPTEEEEVGESRNVMETKSNYSSSLHLGNLFKINKSVRLPLTADFCPWSAQDGKGKQALFGGLFFEDNRRRGNFTCFLDEDGDDDSASQCLTRLFDSAYSDHEEHCTTPSESSEAGVKSGTMGQADSLLSNSDALSTEEYDNNVSEFDEESEETSSFASSSAYKDVRVPYPTITDCFDCQHEYDYIRGSVNAGLDSEWRWFLRGTRRFIRFAS
ncbi:unnamed protein product, partial [Taenia asiatica]|uniref:UBIQUITIN_CONJUGAT_2 domain-containing protein n=1 Tax=Taenia asiatica TaxID=60517 RepID=A0A0R3WGS8_TAEAS